MGWEGVAVVGGQAGQQPHRHTAGNNQGRCRAAPQAAGGQPLTTSADDVCRQAASAAHRRCTSGASLSGASRYTDRSKTGSWAHSGLGSMPGCSRTGPGAAAAAAPPPLLACRLMAWGAGWALRCSALAMGVVWGARLRGERPLGRAAKTQPGLEVTQALAQAPDIKGGAGRRSEDAAAGQCV